MHRVTATAVKMTAAVPAIMDTTLYFPPSQFCRKRLKSDVTLQNLAPLNSPRPYTSPCFAKFRRGENSGTLFGCSRCAPPRERVFFRCPVRISVSLSRGMQGESLKTGSDSFPSHTFRFITLTINSIYLKR
jgi:hypothetical protein